MQTMVRPINPPPPVKPLPSRMMLSSITRGRIKKPMRIVLVGTEGVGKSTFAGGAPSPIFIGAEDGTAQLDVARFPEPKGWQDVLDAVHELTVGEHNYETLCIDTLDWLEPMCWSDVCAKGKKPDIESFGYGKGYAAALDEWRVLLSALDALRDKRGMHVILLAHSWIKTFKNPTGEDFDRYELKLHPKAGGLVKEWSDAVLFANYETFAVEKQGRVRGVDSGARLIHTERRAAWDAKNRYGLPETLPLSWDEFASAVLTGAPAAVEKLLLEVRSLMADVDKETHEKAEAWLATNGNAKDAQKLAQMADRLRAKVNTNTEESKS